MMILLWTESTSLQEDDVLSKKIDGKYITTNNKKTNVFSKSGLVYINNNSGLYHSFVGGICSQE